MSTNNTTKTIYLIKNTDTNKFLANINIDYIHTGEIEDIIWSNNLHNCKHYMSDTCITIKADLHSLKDLCNYELVEAEVSIKIKE